MTILEQVKKNMHEIAKKVSKVGVKLKMPPFAWRKL